MSDRGGVGWGRSFLAFPPNVKKELGGRSREWERDASHVCGREKESE